MTGAAMEALYEVARVGRDFSVGAPPAAWKDLRPLEVGHYLWLDNGYEPHVEARLCYSARFLYVRFDVREARVRARFTRFQDPVYKDSCVEFFIDAFPAERRGYLNFEANALGTFLVQFGPDRSSRRSLTKTDLRGLEARASLKHPVDGAIPGGHWALAYRMPLSLFRRIYGKEIGPGVRSRANFYKCGDETEVRHYGAWNPVGTPAPDFHRPEFFGTLVFGGA